MCNGVYVCSKSPSRQEYVDVYSTSGHSVTQEWPVEMLLVSQEGIISIRLISQI
jgi:hypothetical protein